MSFDRRQQCIGGSICSGSVCTCVSGSQTTTQTLVCQGPIINCTTQSQTIIINNQCFASVQFGQTCNYSQQCVLGASCQLGICTCLPGTTSVSGGCQLLLNTTGIYLRMFITKLIQLQLQVHQQQVDVPIWHRNSQVFRIVCHRSCAPVAIVANIRQ
jgi:hypothetical protein